MTENAVDRSGAERSPSATAVLLRPDAVPTLVRRASAVRDRVQRLAGLRDELQRRDTALMREIGLAKGRLELKPKMDEALHRLQAAVHERTVGAFARLLTAIASDVLPEFADADGPRIALDLGTERGQPALDIEVDRAGAREDLIDGTGGSLVNIVSAGLRFAALARSGRRLFTALDEPDCWIAPERVPAFAGVLGQMAREIGVQCLIISHHDPAAFDGLSSVVHLTRGAPATTTAGMIVARPWGAVEEWDAGQPGIRYIHLQCYRSHTDTRIPLSPGVTVLTGANNLGKSTVVSALRSVTLGYGKDDVIAHGADSARVEIGLEGNQRVVWERVRRGDRKMRWRQLDADGNGLRETPSGREMKGAPEWVSDLLGIAPVDGLDVQIGAQKAPIFLLDQPPSKRAQILSVGRESGLLAAMIGEHGERSRRDRDLERSGEAQLTQIRARLRVLDALDDHPQVGTDSAADDRSVSGPVPGLTTAVRLLEERAAALTVAAAAQGAARQAAQSLRTAVRCSDVARRTAAALDGLPAAPARPPDRNVSALAAAIRQAARWARTERARADTMAVLPGAPASPGSGVSGVAAAIRSAQRAAASARCTVETLAALPTPPPGWAESGHAASAGTIRAAAQRAGLATAALTTAEADIAVAEAELHTLVDDLGGQCPLCGGAIGHDGRSSTLAPAQPIRTAHGMDVPKDPGP